jgi:hypothetical protein
MDIVPFPQGVRDNELRLSPHVTGNASLIPSTVMYCQYSNGLTYNIGSIEKKRPEPCDVPQSGNNQ